MSRTERSAHARRAKKTPKEPKAWSWPMPVDKGGAEPEPLLMAVGKALSYWEHVENHLANLFAVLVGAEISRDRPAPAIRAYGTVVSFRARAAMVDAAAKAYLLQQSDSGWSKTWTDLLEELTGFADRRNDIAHGSAELLYDLKEEKSLGFFLLPGLYASKKYPSDGPPAYRFSAEQVQQLAEHFSDLANKVGRFRHAILTKRRTSPEKPPLPGT
jgi:hypothetical protein